jgi:regulator of cell morphogenesis and NO signaling
MADDNQGAQISAEDWSSGPLERLIEHLSETHRFWRDRTLPRLDALIAASPAGDSETSAALRRVFCRLRKDLDDHMSNEEKVLFPAILAIARALAAGEPAPKMPFGSVRNPIAMVEQDHDIETRRWQAVRDLAGALARTASDQGPTQVLCKELAAFEASVQAHTQLETSVLFPRALRLERQGC